MHLHFIFPRWQKLLESREDLRETLSGYEIGDFRMAGLGVATAAGAVPAGHKITLADQNIDEVDTSIRPDLVCLGFFTPQATRAYKIADRFRAAGVPVLAGGIHPTVMPADALQHCDAVVRGAVEGLWETILADLAQGRLQEIYTGDTRASFAVPRRDLFDQSKYLRSGIIQTSRGCNVGCGFCVVPPCYGDRVVYKPIEAVLEDIASLSYTSFFFGDENLLFPDSANRSYLRELLSKMVAKRLRKHSFMANYPQFITPLREPDIALMSRAFVRQIYLVLGLNAPLKEELADSRLVAAMQRLRDHKIQVLASFNLGHDEDDVAVEPLIAQFCRRTETNLAEFIINTPFPGTATFSEMERAGRILHRRWEHYNCANVVFQPLHESPEALQERYVALWQLFYGPISRTQVQLRYLKGFGADILRS